MSASNGRVEEGVANPAAGKLAGVRVGARVDAGGLWTNLALTPQDSALMAWRHGGSVALRSSGDVSLTQSGSINVSSGAARSWAGSLRGGKGGDVTLAANALGNATGGVLTVAGEIAGYGVDGGGKLLLQAERVSVGRGRQAVAPGVSVLDEGFFASGFSQYEVAGVRGLEVVEGARVRVTMPVLRYTAQAPNASDRNTALETWTPPLYQDDPLKRVLTQRLGADLTLRTGAIYSPDDDRATAQLTLARGASIEVDPRQAIALRGAGQITIDGALRAPGGTLRIDQPPVALKDNRGDGSGHKRSLWVGDGAVLDVAGRAAVALDAQGRRYGWVDPGGAIVIGGEIDTAKGSATSVDAFVVLRPGSLLEASGAFAILDLPQGGSVGVASAGDRFRSVPTTGCTWTARCAPARAAGAAGGVLSVALETPVYENTSVDLVRVQRELLIRQQAAASLPDVADPRAARPCCATATASWRWTATGTAALAPSMCCPMDSSAPAAPSICGPARPSACSPARSRWPRAGRRIPGSASTRPMCCWHRPTALTRTSWCCPPCMAACRSRTRPARSRCTGTRWMCATGSASAPMAISCCRAGCCAPWTAKATAASAWPPTVTCASCAAPWPMA